MEFDPRQAPVFESGYHTPSDPLAGPGGYPRLRFTHDHSQSGIPVQTPLHRRDRFRQEAPGSRRDPGVQPDRGRFQGAGDAGQPRPSVHFRRAGLQGHRQPAGHARPGYSDHPDRPGAGPDRPVGRAGNPGGPVAQPGSVAGPSGYPTGAAQPGIATRLSGWWKH